MNWHWLFEILEREVPSERIDDAPLISASEEAAKLAGLGGCQMG
jgi:hypothetical protein